MHVKADTPFFLPIGFTDVSDIHFTKPEDSFAGPRWVSKEPEERCLFKRGQFFKKNGVSVA